MPFFRAQTRRTVSAMKGGRGWTAALRTATPTATSGESLTAPPSAESQTSLRAGHAGLCPWKAWAICTVLRRHTRLTEAGIPCTLPELFLSRFRGPTGARFGYGPPPPLLPLNGSASRLDSLRPPPL